MKTKKNALGRGLSAILESPDTDITSKDISGDFVVGAIANISIDKIKTNPFQPRTEFEELSLAELTQSIKEQGIIQPVTVRKTGYDEYQLISGERRLRASKLAGLTEIPAYIRVANDEQMLEMALIENIHRADLNAIEISLSYQRLMDECNVSISILADRVGQDRSTITNYIRLLKLPPEIQIAIRDKQISMGHARALISLPEVEDQLNILREIIDRGLSVREVEKWVRELNSPPDKKEKKEKDILPESYVNVRKNLSHKLATKIDISRNRKGKGHISINFNSDYEFDRIISLLQ
ncbi:MAG: ParB/RepB/Spo0J family partition protein [Bacteroidales bacterium]|jgi:ParB family chromosome partitioning protein|nr:ParB/RepB/Spo0J family partition protein [Bacteroidales bacterium]